MRARKASHQKAGRRRLAPEPNKYGFSHLQLLCSLRLLRRAKACLFPGENGDVSLLGAGDDPLPRAGDDPLLRVADYLLFRQRRRRLGRRQLRKLLRRGEARRAPASNSGHARGTAALLPRLLPLQTGFELAHLLPHRRRLRGGVYRWGTRQQWARRAATLRSLHRPWPQSVLLRRQPSHRGTPPCGTPLPHGYLTRPVRRAAGGRDDRTSSFERVLLACHRAILGRRATAGRLAILDRRAILGQQLSAVRTLAAAARRGCKLRLQRRPHAALQPGALLLQALPLFL
eukprot:scaffold6939_cov80-Isochrysis_galbana.AAC.3